jgi:hypothetical protein
MTAELALMTVDHNECMKATMTERWTAVKKNPQQADQRVALMAA